MRHATISSLKPNHGNSKKALDTQTVPLEIVSGPQSMKPLQTSHHIHRMAKYHKRSFNLVSAAGISRALSVKVYQAGVPAVQSAVSRHASHCAWLQPTCLTSGCKYCGRMSVRILAVGESGVGKALQRVRRKPKRKVR